MINSICLDVSSNDSFTLFYYLEDKATLFFIYGPIKKLELGGLSYDVIFMSIKISGNILKSMKNTQKSLLKKNPLKVHFISLCIVTKTAFETIYSKRYKNAYLMNHGSKTKKQFQACQGMGLEELKFLKFKKICILCILYWYFALLWNIHIFKMNSCVKLWKVCCRLTEL